MASMEVTETRIPPEQPNRTAKPLSYPGWGNVYNTSPYFLAVFYRIIIFSQGYFLGTSLRIYRTTVFKGNNKGIKSQTSLGETLAL